LNTGEKALTKSGLKAIIFDMDGVLVDIRSSWQFVHKAFNADNNENLSKYLEGMITYTEFMEQDIRLWGSVNISRINQILDKVPIMNGAQLTISRLKEQGYLTCIISAGISILAQRVQKELNIDQFFANRLIVDDSGRLTGKGEEIVNLMDKLPVLKKYASDQKITPSACAVVGDSIFDIELFEEAGLSIAFNSSDERVNQKANIVINGKDLTKILPYFV
jgi:phosphoserine phosphatase